MEPRKRAWAEIHLGRLAENYRQIRAKIPAHTKYLALVKANAYGHGAVPVARKLDELGADYFAVACLDEAVELREGGIQKPILILGYTDPEQTGELLSWNVTQTIYDEAMAEEFSHRAQELGKVLTVHLKADTGMSRLGFLCDEEHWKQSAEAMLRIAALPGLNAEGLFMHFAAADSDEEDEVAYSKRQIRRYQVLCQELEQCGLHIPLRHCAASAAILNYPEVHFDMVRPGIIQYGLHPSADTVGKLDLRPVMEVKARVASVKELPVGTTVSYGRTRTLTRDSRIAVVTIGYGDGLSRLLSNRQQMLVRGKRAEQVGRVCMDMCMLDVTDIPEAQVGDAVTVFGDGLPLEEKADTIGTITYELMCNVSPRIHRVYRED